MNTTPLRTLTNNRAGYSLSYPRGWKIAGRVVSTEFATGASCQSVRVVDLTAPADAGPGAEVHQSLVQICSHRLTDNSSLDDFMHKTYGDRLPSLFDKTNLDGLPAYRTGKPDNKTFFVQNGTSRIQILAAVVAEPAKHALRLAQIGRILNSLSLSR